MGFFSNNKDNPRPRNEKAMLTIRAIAAAYLFYMAYDMINMYVTGTEEKPSLGLLIGGTAFLVAGGIFIAVLTWKEWKAMQKREAEKYLEELEAREAAEAAAAAEETEEVPALEEAEEIEEVPAQEEVLQTEEEAAE